MAGQADKYLLGYLSCFANTDNSYYGGILITNEKGMPREFRHTDAVRPTRVQQLLYGDSLHAALGETCLGPALLASITRSPDILLIERLGKAMFGEFVSSNGSCALLTVDTSDESVFMDSIAPGGMMHDAIQLRHGDLDNSFVFAYVEAHGSGDRPAQILEECQHSMNLYSPFERIRTVLQHIVQAEASKGR
jgi:hypothetical protein